MGFNMLKRWRAALIILMLAAGGAAIAGHKTDEPTEEDHFAVFTAGNNDYIQNVAAGDVDALMAHYADDAIQMPPGAPNIVGVAAIRAGWEAYFAEYEVIEAVSFIDGVTVTGDRAFAWGHYSQTDRNRADGTISTEHGRFAESDRRGPDGRWIMEVEIWNLLPE